MPLKTLKNKDIPVMLENRKNFTSNKMDSENIETTFDKMLQVDP
jgi:hypothetical protein